jgi:hypothetical protein
MTSAHEHHGPICIPKAPRPASWKDLARQAQAARPSNVPEGLDLDSIDPKPGERAALNIKLRWPRSGVKLTVSFLDNPETELRRMILARMNAWNKTANVAFTETTADKDHADVRIARVKDDGYWSWLGIDIHNHPGKQTMNLDSFTVHTLPSELDRVVCHETGHTLGFEHEHLRAELVELLDVEKTVAFFMKDQGWTREEVLDQVLTPLEKRSILTSGQRPDPRSIMCYDISGECTRSGKPIVGGKVIDAEDFAFAGRVYPKSP